MRWFPPVRDQQSIPTTGALRLRIEMVDPNAPKNMCGFEKTKTHVIFGNPKLTA